MLKRGFKSWCERTSLIYRKKLGLDETACLSPTALAEHLNVKVITPIDIPGLKECYITTLLKEAADTWSAATISYGTSHLIIYNSAHAVTRQANDIMHELAHIIVGHTPQTTHYSSDTNIFLRQYHEDQEDEANCLAAVLLLPREALVKIKSSNMNPDAAAKIYGVSKRLLEMRLHTSGINNIFNRKKFLTSGK